MDYQYEVTRTDTKTVLPLDPFQKNKPTSVSYNIDNDWNALSPKGVLSWKAHKNVLVFFSVSKGYMAGGFNWTEHVKDRAKFNEQTSIDYEFGIKTKLFSDKLIFNANLFYMDIDDMHVYTVIDQVNYITTNAGEAHSKGVELEFKARPFKGFDIIGSLGIIDAEYDKYTNAKGIDCSGKKLEDISDYNFNLAAQYRTISGLFSRFEIKGHGDFYFEDKNTMKQEAYEIYNAKIGYESTNWDLYVYGRNLLDKEYFSYGKRNGSGYIANVGEPRTFGLEACIKF